MIKFYDMESSGEFSSNPIKTADKLAESLPKRSARDIILDRMRAKLIASHSTITHIKEVKISEQKHVSSPPPQLTQEVKA